MELSRHWRLKRIRYGTPTGGLYGEECGECGEKMFPPRDVCTGCGKMVKVRSLYPELIDRKGFLEREK